MSPEQAMAKRMGIDHRTDIFSLGVVMYEMLALRRPFEGDTTQQIVRQIMLEDPVDPRQLRSRVPRDLAVISGKCLEKHPDRRYQTMAELAADIRKHLANEPIVAKPPTAWQRPGFLSALPTNCRLRVMYCRLASLVSRFLFSETGPKKSARFTMSVDIATFNWSINPLIAGAYCAVPIIAGATT